MIVAFSQDAALQGPGSILEEFINEALFRGRTRLGQGAPPLTYQECCVVAENTVSDVNGRRHEIARGKGVYGGEVGM